MPQAKKKTNSRKKGTGASNKRNTKRVKSYQDYKLQREVTIIVAFALSVLLFLCNFRIIGPVGNAVSDVMFGLFGVLAYIFPLYAFGCTIFGMHLSGERHATGKVISLCVIFICLGELIELINGVSKSIDSYKLNTFYGYGVENHKGGGCIAGSFAYGLTGLIGKTGTVIIAIIAILICIVIITENSIINSVKETGMNIAEHTQENREYKKQFSEEERAEREQKRSERDEIRRNRQNEIDEQRRTRKEALQAKKEEQQKKAEEQQNIKDNKKLTKEDDAVLKRNKVVKGVTFDTEIKKTSVTDEEAGNMHEINVNGFIEKDGAFDPNEVVIIPEDETIQDNGMSEYIPSEPESPFDDIDFSSDAIETTPVVPENKPVTVKEKTGVSATSTINKPANTVSQDITPRQNPVKQSKYQFPPISLLTENKNGASGRENRESINRTAETLVETLKIFKVEATVQSICQGPTVTRFELQPKLGTKVSSIKSLSDDIKLAMATNDLRIEAPVPGKSVVGIEIANKEKQSVLLRDLIDTPEFKNNSSNLTFAVGKDITGKTIVYDIDKFPHLLIAGATGSGKSVCINTLIMSLLYKAHPNDLKLIMVDPKVVELSVYNPIPHLLIPVVTDPKKAAAALAWAVNEMMERYKKFADLHVRDLAGYNSAMVEKQKEEGETMENRKLPRIVIIVDELADLMMVAKNDVEESICRLTQLARACGIHLIIATQRPSVDVITGLIKANMPSRIAFAVSSQVDSRTILDKGGAEELLGSGDMLFYPKGLKNPVRLQGAYVSDSDVNDVVDFLKNQGFDTGDSLEIETKINSAGSSSGGSSGGGSEQAEFDEYFMDAAKYIINNNKASIGNLQRVFRIGFNRAARIMDKLAEIGVVSQDEGTKARQVLMTMEEFENYVEENGI